MAEEGLFVYQVLDPPGHAIRLLTLLPGEFSDDIYLSITHEELEDENRTPYDCLSYIWGDAAQAHQKLYISQKLAVDGAEVDVLQFLYVRNNLLAALKYLRLPDTPRVIWIDAICIDQQNLTEKGTEVARMGQIYNKAAQVIIWLGPEDEYTSMALDTIERLSAGVELTWDHRGCVVKPGSEAEAVQKHMEKSKFTPENWTSFSRLIQRPWFRRLWIRQEVLLASKILMRCGYAEVAWEKLEKAIVFVEHRVSRAYVGVDDILFCRSLFPYVGSDILTYTLHRSSLCGYFDSRDLIYANLSTSSAMKALQIKPDYSLTAAETFKDMSCKYLQHFKNLDLFRSCDLQTLPASFKSFVPDFAVPKSESRLFSVYAHAGTRQSYVDIEGGLIELKGRIVDKIRKVSSSRKPIAIRTLSSDNLKDIIETYRAWEPANLMTSTTYLGGGTLLDAFIMLLSNGFCKETYHGSHLPTIQESRESFLAAVWSGGDANLINTPRYKAYIGELMSDRRSEVFFQTVEGYIGASPTDVREGDIVSVLLGASVPMVLRPADDRPHAYRVVGPCFLQGVMLGEALLGPLPEGWLCNIHDNRKWCFRREDSDRRVWEDPRLWPLPAHWQAHFCDLDDENSPCDGSCEADYVKAGQLVDRWFFDTRSKEKWHEDPRLDVRGLETGGLELQSFTLV
ncbi:HET-domain-containing protein [Clathrospora elynae]|uniref:HET-domain-containing protein n=1 Tax=Clathrospora elynae TaxID=706981 RepID=A0A6A5SG54_9PLEO|nr:HET-domain-containing protein [Clathrospora elynae]